MRQNTNLNKKRSDYTKKEKCRLNSQDKTGKDRTGQDKTRQDV